MTPVASVECYDESEECASILDNGCFRNKDICKKVTWHIETWLKSFQFTTDMWTL